jgi:hypothetical protein
MAVHNSVRQPAKWVSPMLLLGSVLAAIGCAEAPTEGDGNTAGAGWAGTGTPTAGTWGAGTGGTGAAGTTGTAGTSSVAAGRAALGTTPMPCDVTASIKLRCQSCHGATPISGVPMSLMSWEDFDAPSISNPAVKVRDLVKVRAHDVANPMPPTGVMPTEDLALLDAWIDSGGLAGTDPSCAPVIDEPDAGPGYEGEVPPFADNCYEIRAHANGNWDQPLMVSGENYGTFYFDAPWPDNAQGVYFETLADTEAELNVLHHWLIYADEAGNSPDGQVNYPGFGTHPTSPTLIAGWAPGADNNDIPTDVGLQLHGPNRKMMMEIHFYGANTALPVSAGVKICTVEKAERLRPNIATVSWLGTETGISIPAGAKNHPATGTCNPQWPAGVQEIQILRSWPHMHLMGRRMTSTVIRQNGSREDMHTGTGWPFDFNNEISWKTEFTLRPGDRVETTCYYDSDRVGGPPVGVGFENHFEMCFNFVLAYPAKALVNKGFIGSSSLTNSSTACLQ